MTLAKAIETRDLTQLPSRRDEDWRWTDLRGLIRELPPVAPETLRAIDASGPFKGLTDAELVRVDGHLNWWPGEDLDNIQFFEHASPDNPYDAKILPMAEWAASDMAAPMSILQFDEDGIASLRLVSAVEGARHQDRVGIVVEAGVTAVLLESHEGRAGKYLANRLIEIFIEEGARLERVVIADEAPEGIAVTTALVTLDPGASYAQTLLTSGARRQRIETRVAHPGEGASVRLDGAYLLRDQRHADLTTTVTHSGLDGQTSQLTKGVVHDQARGVFQGRIVVEKGADKTDARMGHHALILSDRAEVDAKPELLIFADDVQCAHGNTVGALDENALFYARQRGIPLDEARAMLTHAFLGEVVDRIEHEGAREVAAAWVSRQLGRSA